MTINLKELAAGAIFIAFGAYFAISAYSTLAIGTAFQMGPGFFPILLGLLLIALGLGVAIRGVTVERTPFGDISPRGILLILAAPIFFGVTVEGLGLVASTFLTCLIAVAASRRVTIARAALVSALLTVFCVAVFGYALMLNLPIVGRWLQM
jgi:hypothetical protein